MADLVPTCKKLVQTKILAQIFFQIRHNYYYSEVQKTYIFDHNWTRVHLNIALKQTA